MTRAEVCVKAQVIKQCCFCRLGVSHPSKLSNARNQVSILLIEAYGCPILVQLFGPLIEMRLLFDCGKALDVERPSCREATNRPPAFISLVGQFLGYDLATLILDEVSFGEAAGSLRQFPCPHKALGEAC